MSYEDALKAAGAEIHEFKQFGSYQGSWFALVTYNGEKGWIQGSYGSCSGCDAFEAEFGWTDEECDAHRYQDSKPDCEGCAAARADKAKRLAEFGKTYLEGISTPEPILLQLEKDAEWDSESAEAAGWIRSTLSTERSET